MKTKNETIALKKKINHLKRLAMRFYDDNCFKLGELMEARAEKLEELIIE